MLASLVAWFQENQRLLPWRVSYDPYHVWVSEVMLQQTQAARVVPAFENDRVAMSAITLTSLPASVMSTRGKQWLEKTLKGPPSAARVFIAGDQITGAVEVYAPRGTKAVVLTASIKRSDGSSVLTADQAVAAESGRGESGFVIDTGELRPGGYLLRLTTGSGNNRQERTVPFEIVARP